MKKYLFIILIALVSCVEALEVEIPGDGSNLLVIEGGINTKFGPHTIQLTRTAKYGSIFDGFIKKESGAIVTIRDNTGKTTFLSEVIDGIYQTPNSFKGAVGVTYTLQIESGNGVVYNSIPETIEPVAEMDSIYAKFISKLSANPLNPITGLQMFVDFQDTPNEKNYYLWKYNGAFQINANPELHLDPETGNPAPLDCCATCWEQESKAFSNLLKDNTIDGTNVSMPIVFIEDDGIHFGDKYFVKIEQHSISFDAYSFYLLLNQQLSIKGDIFDPPPATTRGNVINVSNPDENVIGFFTVSDVREKEMFLYPEQLTTKRENTLIRNDCRIFSSTTTVEKPTFWF
jgi:hypothetical protein